MPRMPPPRLEDERLARGSEEAARVAERGGREADSLRADVRRRPEVRPIAVGQAIERDRDGRRNEQIRTHVEFLAEAVGRIRDGGDALDSIQRGPRDDRDPHARPNLRRPFLAKAAAHESPLDRLRVWPAVHPFEGDLLLDRRQRGHGREPLAFEHAGGHRDVVAVREPPNGGGDDRASATREGHARQFDALSGPDDLDRRRHVVARNRAEEINENLRDPKLGARHRLPQHVHRESARRAAVLQAMIPRAHRRDAGAINHLVDLLVEGVGQSHTRLLAVARPRPCERPRAERVAAHRGASQAP